MRPPTAASHLLLGVVLCSLPVFAGEGPEGSEEQKESGKMQIKFVRPFQHLTSERMDYEYHYAKSNIARIDELLASDKRKVLDSCYSQLKGYCLCAALCEYLAGNDGEMFAWFRRSVQAGVSLFRTPPHTTKITSIDTTTGKVLSVKHRFETSFYAPYKYENLVQVALLLGDKDLLRQVGEIDHRIYFGSESHYTYPEPYEEAKVLREVCLGRENFARARLKRWDGTQIMAELSEFEWPAHPDDPPFEEWTGCKTTFIRGIEAVLNNDPKALGEALTEHLKDYQGYRAKLGGWVSLPEKVICLPAVSMAVFARRHGMEVDVKNNYLPMPLVDILTRADTQQAPASPTQDP